MYIQSDFNGVSILVDVSIVVYEPVQMSMQYASYTNNLEKKSYKSKGRTKISQYFCPTFLIYREKVTKYFVHA